MASVPNFSRPQSSNRPQSEDEQSDYFSQRGAQRDGPTSPARAQVPARPPRLYGPQTPPAARPRGPQTPSARTYAPYTPTTLRYGPHTPASSSSTPAQGPSPYTPVQRPIRHTPRQLSFSYTPAQSSSPYTPGYSSSPYTPGYSSGPEKPPQSSGPDTPTKSSKAGVGSMWELSYGGQRDESFNSLNSSFCSKANGATSQRETAHEIMAEALYRFADKERFFSDAPGVWNGVALRFAKGRYVCCPQDDVRLQPWIGALSTLKVTAAVTITSNVINAIISSLPDDAEELALTAENRIQVVETMAHLHDGKKAQGAAVVRSEGRLIVWADKAEELMAAAKEVEAKMVQYVWQRATAASPLPPSDGADPSISTLLDAAWSPLGQTEGVRVGPGGEKLITSRVSDEKNMDDPEALETHQERSTVMIAPVIHGLAIAVDLVICSLTLRALATETATDGTYLRWSIAVAVPAIFVAVLFLSDSVLTGFCMLIGPVRQMNVNTKYYSSVAPQRMTTALPHVTIQIPVYKEPLKTVLAPTIESVNKAIQTYELQGGTASILVSEDGLLLVDEKERSKRLDFYDQHHIAWVARPGHNMDGFERRGRFKKASNLNFTCSLSLAVERLMAGKRPTFASVEWSQAEETALYEDCLAEALAQAHPLAEASGNIRIGELILLIDCDTRVPQDCFLDAASEMSQCPEVAILQHCSGVMFASERNNYFEQGIGFFTRNVNFSISFCVANGDTAPFMGHNAYLRWSALQEAAAIDPEDGKKKIWAEWTVSEDFEMSMRLLMAGYITRWATYSKNAFLEGVSLTAQDELNRWQKYAFGVSELLFNPIHKWLYKGPFTPLFRKYMWVKEIPTHAKFASTSYMFSYCGIACAFPLTAALIIIQAWFAPILDQAFIRPFQVWISVIVVFSGLGNLAYIVAKYRARTHGFFESVKEHATWLVFMLVFFNGISYHVMTALVAHLVSYNMTWGSTLKSLEDSHFFRELPAILRRNWVMLLLCILIIGGSGVLLSDLLPIEWQAHGGFFVFWPLFVLYPGHILYHLLLNPQLLRFSFCESARLPFVTCSCIVARHRSESL